MRLQKVLILYASGFTLLLLLLLYYAERLLCTLALIKNRCFLSLSKLPSEMTNETHILIDRDTNKVNQDKCYIINAQLNFYRKYSISSLCLTNSFINCFVQFQLKLLVVSFSNRFINSQLNNATFIASWW